MIIFYSISFLVRRLRTCGSASLAVEAAELVAFLTLTLG